MKILILHSHWNNRGDEAALRAMIDELIEHYPKCEIKVILHSDKIEQFAYCGNVNCEPLFYPRTRDYYTEGLLTILSKGKIVLSKRGKHFKKMVEEADIVLHGPGGPSIGDIYYHAEKFYLYRLLVVKAIGTPYAFYAPSMGPFNKKKHFIRNIMRRTVLNGASVFCLREPISKDYVMDFGGVQEPIVTLDSAFQHDVDIEKYKKILDTYSELKDFLEKYNKIVGITITHLMWNPKYKGNEELKEKIFSAFTEMVQYLQIEGYGVLFIPQLFGRAHDKPYMEQFATEKCFILSDEYDCYFQQYIISKMYALIGMRYHSNIFSAKMGRPFVSVAYEQKMSGFMEKINLTQYCIEITDLSFEQLKEKFEKLVVNYDEYEDYLKEKTSELKEEAVKSTDLVVKFLNSLEK